MQIHNPRSVANDPPMPTKGFWRSGNVSLATLALALCTTPLQGTAGGPHAVHPPQTPAACRLPMPLHTSHLYGNWRVQGVAATSTDRGVDAVTTLRLERHPEYADSLRGTLTSAFQAPVLLSGDWEDGELILDESPDGLRIGAVWVLHIRADGCRLSGRGHRRLAGEDTGQPLSMDNLPGWP